MMISIITATKGNVVSERTVDSIKAQTNKNFEWIVVHDKVSPVEEFYTSHARKEIWLDGNYGPSVARNVGFQVSNGDIIAYVDDDDELSPYRIEHIYEMFNQYDIEIVFDGYTIHDDGKYFQLNYFDYGTSSDVINALKVQNIAIPMGVSHTRSPFVMTGGFQRGIVCGEDGILWRRMCDIIPQGKRMVTDFNAGTYYVNKNGQSRTQRRFEEGGFAFDGSKNDNGAYLDQDWFKTFSSVKLFDKAENK